MNSRTENILVATVKEYIRTGAPVSSNRLFLDYDFGIKPASIRSELNELEETGWLEQLHISGGRVPTDKALELFAEKVREELISNPKKEKNIVNLAELIIEGELKSFVHELSQALHLLSAGLAEDNLSVHTCGLDELFNCMEVPTTKVFYEIAKDVESLEARMTELLEDKDENYNNGPRAFIGKKSPLIRHAQVTTIFDIFEINDSRVLFATFGPRRMDYRKNFKVFLTLRDTFKNYE
ncbi:MAG: hypothetical protein Q8L47_05080 [bacterium]|nr:hypothetical protein [bacterium]